MKTTVAPSIYVADLAAYNAGIFHGKWILLEGKDSDDVYQEIEAMLAEGAKLHSQFPGEKHEEFAIHDYEGFGPIKVREYDSISDLVEHVERMDDDPDKYFAYISAMGDGDGFDPDNIMGPYDSTEDYAWEMLDLMTDSKDLTSYLESKGVPFAEYIKFDAKDFAFSESCNGTVSFGESGGKVYAIIQ